MKLSEAFEHVLVQLEGMSVYRYFGYYVCWAIEDCDLDKETRAAALNHIKFLLEGCSTVGLWLDKYHPEFYTIVWNDMKAYRIEWVKHIIKTLEAEGK